MALTYNGTNEYSTVASLAELNWTGGASLCFWFKTGGSLPANNDRIFVHGQFGIIDGNFLTADNTLTITFFYDATSATLKSSALSINTEYHFALCYDEGTDLYLYENGALKASNGSMGTINYYAGTYGTWVASSQAAANHANGTYWDVRQYNNCITPEKASILYTNRGGDKLTDGLVLRAMMNEGSNTSSQDVSGNNNTMTHNNTPTIASSAFRHY